LIIQGFNLLAFVHRERLASVPYNGKLLFLSTIIMAVIWVKMQADKVRRLPEKYELRIYRKEGLDKKARYSKWERMSGEFHDQPGQH